MSRQCYDDVRLNVRLNVRSNPSLNTVQLLSPGWYLFLMTSEISFNYSCLCLFEDFFEIEFQAMHNYMEIHIFETIWFFLDFRV